MIKPMDPSEHMHWLSTSWWVGYLSIGGFSLFIIMGLLSNTAKDFLSGNLELSTCPEVSLIIALILPFSLSCLIVPFIYDENYNRASRS
jgi:hypothetical protein